MFPIGTALRCKYNHRIIGRVTGYGSIYHDLGSILARPVEPVYLIALADRMDLLYEPHMRVVSVMVIEERNAEEIKG